MIRQYLSNNNEMCYSTKINNFSPTKRVAANEIQPLRIGSAID